MKYMDGLGFWVSKMGLFLDKHIKHLIVFLSTHIMELWLEKLRSGERERERDIAYLHQKYLLILLYIYEHLDFPIPSRGI